MNDQVSKPLQLAQMFSAYARAKIHHLQNDMERDREKGRETHPNARIELDRANYLLGELELFLKWTPTNN